MKKKKGLFVCSVFLLCLLLGDDHDGPNKIQMTGEEEIHLNFLVELERRKKEKDILI